jgi:hypothetical protein
MNGYRIRNSGGAFSVERHIVTNGTVSRELIGLFRIEGDEQSAKRVAIKMARRANRQLRALRRNAAINWGMV